MALRRALPPALPRRLGCLRPADARWSRCLHANRGGGRAAAPCVVSAPPGLAAMVSASVPVAGAVAGAVVPAVASVALAAVPRIDLVLVALVGISRRAEAEE